MRWGFAFALAGLISVSGLSSFQAADDKPKYDNIKEIMKLAHGPEKDEFYKKVANGKGSDDDKKKLVDLYTALAKLKPPRGEADAWKDKTDDLVAAAQAVAKGEKGSGEKLLKAADCIACHREHKPPKKK